MIKNFFIKLGLFLGVFHKVKADYLCVDYGCFIRKSINCPEGMCTKHHLMWHQQLSWFYNNPQPFWIYHCQPISNNSEEADFSDILQFPIKLKSVD